MNLIHRIVWNERTGTYVAVGETTCLRGKRGGGGAALLAAALLGLAASGALAQVAPPPRTLPTGGQVAAGQATLSSSGARLDVQQTSQKAIINWQSFSIGADAQVNFMQPNASAVALNRVLGSDPSSIFGRLTANGQVFLVNGHGVLFGSSARVDVGGLAASTLGLADADFLSGRYRFAGGGGSVLNQGELSARDGGYIALLAPEVRNEGVISATLGTVALAAGQAVTLQTQGPIGIAVEQGALDALVENKQLIRAEDGRVLLSARSSSALQRAVVRNDGSIEAKGARSVGGVIRLEGDNVVQNGRLDVSSAVAAGGSVDARASASDGSLQVSGQIDATGLRGGQVLLTGHSVALVDAQVNASGVQAGGQVLVGGDVQGRNAQVPNAQHASVDAHSELRADATQRGQGGKVVVWADQDTRVSGRLSARGGASGGDGGFIETSGKRFLSIGGARVDASAAHGAQGQWLLDPSDVTITHGSSNALTSGVFDPGTSSTIGDTEINAALNGGTDVTIQTTAGSGGTGAIVVNGDGDGGGAAIISNASGGVRGLSLITAGSIDIRSGASISGSSGNALSVNLNAGGGSTIAGTIDNFGGTTSLTGAATLNGTLRNGTVVGLDASPTLSSNYGRLDNVTLGGTSLSVSGELHIYNDLTLANGVTVNAGANNWYFNGQDTGQIAGTVHRLTTPGTATLNLAGTNLNIFAVNGQTLQIESGMTVQGYGNLSQYWGGNTITNAGSLMADTNGQTLTVSPSTFTNSGAVTATAGSLNIQPTSFTNTGTANAQGGTLYLNADSWSNPGKINADSGTLNLGGVFTVADLTGNTHYGRTGGSVNITGTLDNTGTSVDIGSAGLFGTGGLSSLSGRILAGTVSSSDATVLSSNYGRLDNVTLGGTSLSVSGELHIYNDLTLANGVTVNAGANNWYFNGQDTGQIAGTVHRLTTPGTATLNLAGTNLNIFAVNGQTLQIESGMTVQGYGNLSQYWGGNTITNAGSLMADTNGQTLTVSPSTFTNSGAVTATAGSLNIQPTSFTNTGTANAQGGTLYLNADSWSNPGKINADSGTLNLGGVFTVADLTGNTHYGRTGGSVNITGTLDNTGTSVDIGSAGLFGTGGLSSLSGRILAGTVSSSDATVLSSNYGRLDNVTLGGTSLSVSGELHIYNDLTLANGVTVNAGANNWYFNGQDTGQIAGTVHRLTTPGTATLNLAGTNLNIFAVNGQTLQIESGMTVQGYGNLSQYWGGNTITNAGSLMADTNGQTLTVSPSTFTNSGAVTATAGSLNIQPTSFTNTGTANAQGGTLYLNADSWSNPGKINADSGTLNLGGVFTVADLTGNTHYGRTGGSVNITGTLDNTGTSVDIGSAGLFGTGGLSSLSGRILAGTVSSSDATVLSSNYGRLDNVTLGGTSLSVSGELHIYNDLTLANGVTVNAGANNWYFNGQDTGQIAGTVHRLTTPGTATLNLAGTNLNIFAVNGQTLQIESGMTVQGYGNLSQYWGGNTITNAGSLMADTNGQTLTVSPSTFTNSGAVTATAGSLNIQPTSFTNTGTANAQGGTLYLNADSWSNPGKINADSGTLNLGGVFTVADLTGNTHYGRTGGSVNITGTLDNTGTSVDIGSAGLFGTGGLSSLSGRILAGTVSSSDATVLSSNYGRLDNVTLGGTSLSVSGELHIYNDLTLANGVTVNAGANNWYFNGQDTGQIAGTVHRLTTPGTATLNLAGTNLNIFAVNGQTLQIESGMTVQGYGNLSQTWGGNTITNAGSLMADTNGQTLTVSPSTFTNSGTVAAAAGATVYVPSGFVSTGSLAGSGSITVGTGSARLTNQGSINPGGTGATGTLTINGDLLMSAGASLNIELGGTSAGQFDRLVVSGALSGAPGGGGDSFGTLGVSKVNGYTFVDANGDNFALLDAGSGANSGSFDAFSVTRMAAAPTYAANAISLLATPKVLSVSADVLSKVYGAADPTLSFAATGFEGSDDLSNAFSGALSRAAGKDVGAYAVNLGSLISPLGYAITFTPTNSFSITPAPLTVTVTPVTKVYDGGLVALGTASVSSGTLFSGDTLSGGSFAFVNRNAGSGKTVTVSGVTVGDGVHNSNYTLSYAANTSSVITPYALAVTGVSALNKVYDASLVAGLAGQATVVGLLGDDVSVAGTGSGSFASKNVGTAKAVTVTGYSLSGADAANYSAVQPSALTANITAATIAVTGLTAVNKTYDTTTTATLSGSAAVSGLLGDDVSVLGTGSGSFANKNVGSAKAVTVTGYSLGGADAANYSVVQPAGITASITAANLALTGLAAANKVYDTTTAATLSGSAAVSGLAGDDVTLLGTGTGSFANKNVGTAKAVTVSGYSLAGADAANYSVGQPSGLAANITAANLAVTGVSASNKVYSATTNALLAGSASVSALLGDSVSVGGTGSGQFADKNVGTAKAVTVTGYTLSGTDAKNYSVVQPTGISANITAASLAVTGVAASNKVYDATLVAHLTGTANVTGLLNDDVSVAGAGAASFANKNVGTAKAVAVTGYTLSGADAANYTVVQPGGLTANITAANLAVTGVSATDKVYDASATAALTGSASGTGLLGDSVFVVGTGVGSFASKNAGTGKAVSVTGYTLNGADAANYSVVQPAGLSATISAATLSVTGVVASNKVYDTTAVATLTGNATANALLGDDVTVTGVGVGSFANKNVGTAKTVTVSGYSLGGADAANYSVLQPTSLAANITQASLAVTGLSATDKVYDATTTAALAGTASVAALSGDTVSLVGAGSGSFANKNVGTGKAVAVTGYTLSGADAANYTVVQPSGLSANISAANLAVTGISASNKVYDATTAATLIGTASVTGLLGDTVSVAGTGIGSFANKNVGTAKEVVVTGYTLSGADGANYDVAQPSGLSANVSTATLSIAGVAAVDKVYDAGTVASLTGSAAVKAFAGDDVTVIGSGVGRFANKDVGAGKAVTVSGYGLGGADAANYLATQPTGLSASVTPAQLAVSGITALNKVHDGTALAALAGAAAVSPLGGDVVGVTGTGRGEFAITEIANAIEVSVTGYALSGADAGNYSVLQPSGLRANILVAASTPKPLPTTVVQPAQAPAAPSVSTALATPASVVQATGTATPVSTSSAGTADVGAAATSGSASGGMTVTVPVSQGSAFSLSVPEEAMTRGAGAAPLAVDARATGGGELPAWLSFDPVSRTFSGEVPTGIQTLRVMIVSRDEAGKESQVEVTLRFVGAPPPAADKVQVKVQAP